MSIQEIFLKIRDLNCQEMMSYLVFLFFIVFYLKVQKIISSISLKYPQSLYLSNGNIFVIHRIGISIYDHLMTKKIRDVLNFTENEIINIDDLSKITITAEEKYIFSIIKDRIYIFDDEGSLVFKNHTSILEDNANIKYYSLVAFKSENDTYKYPIPQDQGANRNFWANPEKKYVKIELNFKILIDT